MKWIDRLNEAIDYIEKNITEKINYEQLGKIACCSSYHFQRMFAYIADVPLSEYIRRRRMSLAAADLQREKGKIIDIAMKYGYTSPTAFNRAFQSIHGIAPSLVKQNEVSLKTFAPISFNMNIKGTEELNFKIQNKKSFRIIGITHQLFNEGEKNAKLYPEIWKKAKKDGTIQKLTSIMDNSFAGLLGVSACDNYEKWQYFVAVASKKEKKTENSTKFLFKEFVIPSYTWAVFSCKGNNPEIILELGGRIVNEWFPSYEYKWNKGPKITIQRHPVSSFDNYGKNIQKHEFEMWIPISKMK